MAEFTYDSRKKITEKWLTRIKDGARDLSDREKKLLPSAYRYNLPRPEVEWMEKLLEEGRVNGYTCEPQYRGTSFIPCAVKVTARKDGADVLTETIHIW